MSAKTVPNSVFIGNEGAYLVPQLVNEMRFLWTPSGQFELGIDGTIEVVDPATSKDGQHHQSPNQNDFAAVGGGE